MMQILHFPLTTALEESIYGFNILVRYSSQSLRSSSQFRSTSF